MNFIYKITLILLTVSLIAACSQKKNTFLSRNMHALTTEYNILYNGEIAYEDAKMQLAAGYKDNFWDILPIERIEIEENLETVRGDQPGSFSVAEEKATKAIQKHSMYIDGKENNPKIDESYMLLGKARYYEGRFIPALDAFNFILDRYPESNSVNAARIWKAKTNVRLQNEEVAIRNLKSMLSDDYIEHEDWVDGHAMIAEAYVNIDSLAEALPYIKIAAENIKNNELKGRYLFIKGQLHNALGETDSANAAFDKVIELKRRTSRSYYINAFLEKSKNFDYENGDQVAQLELFEKLVKDRENRPFLDRIYYSKAEFHRINGDIPESVEAYNKSIRNFKEDRILQSKNYYTLAEINFDDARYRTAGQYYDSTLIFMDDKSREWRRVKKKRENLDDVIHYEEIAVVNDSILNLVAMNEEERMNYFVNYTDNLREKALQDSIQSAKSAKEIADNEFFTRKKDNKTSASGTFYFYNPSTVSYGKQEFRKQWGDRALEDDWRTSSKTSSAGELAEIQEEEGESSISENILFKPETYISQIPTDPGVIDSINGERNFAYYQLGLIYKEKFREYELAAERLEKVLENNPEERLIVPSKYNLLRIYEILERPDKVAYYTNEILTHHGDSRYAEILRNPNTLLATDESSPQYKYKELYRMFEAEDYQTVIEKCEEYILQYDGTEIVPKFELLKAIAIGKKEGFSQYEKALNFVALTYPNSEEGKQAQKIIDDLIPKFKTATFESDEKPDNWKLIYQFPISQKEEAEQLKTLIDQAILDFEYTDMSTSLDYYTDDINFVVVHGLKSKLGSRGFGETLHEKKEYKVKHPFFEISSTNYQTLQIHKNLESYLNKDNNEPNPATP